MRSILKFLCVVIMLQVATPLVHGMHIQYEEIQNDQKLSVDDEEIDEGTALLDNSSTFLEKSKQHWLLTGFQKIKRFIGNLCGDCCGMGCCSECRADCVRWRKKIAVVCTLGLLGGAALVTYELGPHTPDVTECPEVKWNRPYVECLESSSSRKNFPFEFAILRCQEETQGNNGFAVPVCAGDRKNSFAVVGWEKIVNLNEQENCSKILKMEQGMSFGYFSPKATEGAWAFCNKFNVPCCEFETEIGVGFGMEMGEGIYYYEIETGKWVNGTYNKAELMEGEKCKPLADKARKLANCKGSFAYNNDLNEPKRSKQKSKKRTKRKRRT